MKKKTLITNALLKAGEQGCRRKELLKPSIGGPGAAKRIHELRGDGYDIPMKNGAYKLKRIPEEEMHKFCVIPGFEVGI
jgi:hypothetical protein